MLRFEYVYSYAPMRPHGINQYSFLVYPLNLRIWVTVAFWTLLLYANSSAKYALVLSSCSYGYDFAIPSSRLHLTMQTLGVALGFVGNYAPRGLSPQTGGMPAILRNVRRQAHQNKKTAEQPLA